MDLLDQARSAARRLADKPGEFVWISTSFEPGRSVVLSISRRKGRARLRAECGNKFAKARLPFNYGEEQLVDALTELFVRAAGRGRDWKRAPFQSVSVIAPRACELQRSQEAVLDAWLASRTPPAEPPRPPSLLSRLARLVRRQ